MEKDGMGGPWERAEMLPVLHNTENGSEAE